MQPHDNIVLSLSSPDVVICGLGADSTDGYLEETSWACISYAWFTGIHYNLQYISYSLKDDLDKEAWSNQVD